MLKWQLLGREPRGLLFSEVLLCCPLVVIWEMAIKNEPALNAACFKLISRLFALKFEFSRCRVVGAQESVC